MNPILDLSATGKQSSIPRTSGACWICISIISLVRTAMPIDSVPTAMRSWLWFCASQDSWSQDDRYGRERMEERRWLWDEESTEFLRSKLEQEQWVCEMSWSYPEDEVEVWEQFLASLDIDIDIGLMGLRRSFDRRVYWESRFRVVKWLARLRTLLQTQELQTTGNRRWLRWVWYDEYDEQWGGVTKCVYILIPSCRDSIRTL